MSEAFDTSSVTFGKYSVFPAAVSWLEIKRRIRAAHLRAVGGLDQVGAQGGTVAQSKQRKLASLAAVAEAKRPGAFAAIPSLRFGPRSTALAARCCNGGTANRA